MVTHNMKRVFFVFAFFFSCIPLGAQNSWRVVMDSCRNGSYSAVYPMARSLFERALEGGASDELLRSAVYLCGVDYCFKESPKDSSVYRLNAIMPLLKPVERNVARALLVREYWGACRYGAHKIQPSDNPAADYKYWGMKRCQDTIDSLVACIIGDKDMLRNVAPERFAYIFDTVSFSNDGYAVGAFTPTLYEVLLASVFEGLGRMPEEAFYIDFNELLTLSHSESRQIQLLCEWARGVEDAGVERCLEFEIYRWGYLYRRAGARCSESRFCVRALERSVQRFDSLAANSPNLAVLYYLLAEMWNNVNCPDSSARCCNVVETRWRGSEVAMQCAHLLQEIRKPWAQLYVETAPCSNASVPALVEYRNMDSLYFSRYWARKMNDSVLRTEPLQRWCVALPKHDDVLGHSVLVPIPPIPQGKWFIVISSTPNPLDGIWGYTFQESYDVVMLFSDTVVGGGYIENGNVIVVDRVSGEPVAGVPVTNSYSAAQGKGAGGHLTDTTDSRGVAFIDVTRIADYGRTDCVFTVFNDYRLTTDRWHIWDVPHNDSEKSVSVVIDRPIYRQGDTVHFAVVAACFSGFQKAKPLKGEKYLVRLSHSRVLDSLWIVTDDWGEADGWFPLPTSAMSGDYAIHVVSEEELEEEDSWYEGTVANFSVEPLRQPHFKIELSLADTLLLFDKSLTVTGSVLGYNGMPEANAMVRLSSEAVELYDGSYTNNLKTDSLGNFAITLPPVRSNGSSTQRVDLKVWVTDLSGETQQESISFLVEEKPVLLRFATENLILSQVHVPTLQYPNPSLSIRPVECKSSCDVPLRTNLGCRLSRLARPDRLRLPSFRYIRSYEQILTEEEFSKLFPHYAFDPQGGDYTHWKVDSVIFDLVLTTDSNGSLQLPVPDNLPSGVYKVEVNHPLSDGLEDFIVYLRPHETIPQTPDMLYCDVSSPFVEVGDSIRLRLSSALPLLHVVVEVSENNADNLERSAIHWVTLSNEVKEFALPVHKRMLGKTIVIKVHAIQNLSSCSRSFSFIVNPHRQLKFDITTFRHHLQSGVRQRWTLGVTDEYGRSQSARMIVSMFDKSLYESLSPYDIPVANRYQLVLPESLNLSEHIYYPLIFGCSEKSYSDWAVRIGNRTPPRDLSSFNLPMPNYFKLALLQNFMPVYMKDGAWCYSPNLHGVVTDQKTDEPLPFVNVILKQAGRNVIGVQTDFDGVYSFHNIPLGIYEMEIACVGYRKNSSMVQIGTGGSTLPFNQQLIPSATNLEEVCIVDAKVPIIDFGILESGNQRISGTSRSNSQPLIPNSHLRQNLSSLAFFRPNLVANRKGKATLEFTAPDRLTEWDIFGVAWTKDMKIGSFKFSTVTSNPLMVQPLAPRFLRPGDTIDFAVTVSNSSDSLQEVQVSFELQGRVGEKDSVFFQQSRSGLKLKSHVSQSLKFRIPVPMNLFSARYKVVAQSPHASDGEQDNIPVQPNKERVTQSLAMYLNGKGEKHFTLKAPQNCQLSVVNYQLSVTTNPLWTALASMPYLRELKNPSTLYLANSLAADLMSQSVFKSFPWLKEKLGVAANPAAPDSRFADYPSSVTDYRAPITDSDSIEARIEENVDKLISSLNPDGGWSWMPERGKSSVNVTRSILETLHNVFSKPSNRLQQVTNKALSYIDNQMELLHGDTSVQRFNESTVQRINIIDYLYLRSLYPFNDTIPHSAFHDWYAQIKKELHSVHHLTTSTTHLSDHGSQITVPRSQFNNLFTLRTSARLAQIFYLNGDTSMARELVRRLKQSSLLSEEMGMYWRDNLGGCYYYQRPIETQALLIETFALVTPQDTESVARMQQWLLKQKQTTHWGSDMATLAAIKALLISTNPEPTSVTTVKAGPHTLVAKDSFAPVTQSFYHFTPDMGEITLSKSESGIVWGAAYLQYFASLDSIPYNEMGIKLKKELYIVQSDGSLRMAKQFRVGDRVRVRILFDCDRTLEYLELKDQRSGAFEPCSTHSGWEWNDGLRYYVSVENSSTSCYIDHLDKGHYLVEYDLWVNASGSFSEGIATMQCLYAPEFRSNTSGNRIRVVEK